MNKLNDRIRKCVDLAGSGEVLAQKTAIPRRTLESYLTGASEPKASRLAAIAKAAGVSVNWLVTGEGGQVDSPTSLKSPESPSKLQASSEDFVYLPLYDVAASAGHGSIVEDERIVDFLAFRKSWVNSKIGASSKDLALIEVSGNSMSPTLNNGDIVLVNLSDTNVSMDGIYAIFFDGHLYVKRLQSIPEEKINVISDNPAFPPWTVNSSDLQPQSGYKVVGKVVWAGSHIH